MRTQRKRTFQFALIFVLSLFILSVLYDNFHLQSDVDPTKISNQKQTKVDSFWPAVHEEFASHIVDDHDSAQEMAPIQADTEAPDLHNNEDSAVVDIEAKYQLFIKHYKTIRKQSPPAQMRKWFDMAIAKQCTLDSDAYDMIYRNFQLFRDAHETCVQTGNCEKGSAVISPDMVKHAESMALTRTVQINGAETNDDLVKNMLGPAVEWMPSMKITINHLDEPRVLKRSAPLKQYDHVYYREETMEWGILNYRGITSLLMDVCDVDSRSSIRNHGFFIAPDTFSVTDKLAPIFSQSTKLSCFADILYPSSYFWYAAEQVPWAYPLVESKIDDNWNSKKDIVHWRGSTTGGHAEMDNQFMDFHRQRLVLKAQNISVEGVEVDIKIANVLQCGEEACRYQQQHLPRADAISHEDSTKHKYLIDIDGNTFSQRILPFLRFSQSVVIKLHIFQDWITEQLKPFKHYIPASMSLEDLQDKIEWARDNDDQALEIAVQGQLFAQKRLRKDDMTCYMTRLLLEYHKLTMPSEK
eukprot:Partr_v1_DN28567_c0_g2_i1_m72817 putative capsule-associated protein CAP1